MVEERPMTYLDTLHSLHAQRRVWAGKPDVSAFERVNLAYQIADARTRLGTLQTEAERLRRSVLRRKGRPMQGDAKRAFEDDRARGKFLVHTDIPLATDWLTALEVG